MARLRGGEGVVSRSREKDVIDVRGVAEPGELWWKSESVEA